VIGKDGRIERVEVEATSVFDARSYVNHGWRLSPLRYDPAGIDAFNSYKTNEQHERAAKCR
jgi:hypothetical protein